MGTLGIMSSLNIMVWHYSMMVGGLVSLAVGATWFIAYNNAWAILREEADEDEIISSAEAGYATTVLSGIQTDMVYNMAMEAGAMLTLGAYAEDWMLAQWWAMEEEERMAVWEEKHGEEGKKGHGGHAPQKSPPLLNVRASSTRDWCSTTAP